LLDAIAELGVSGRSFLDVGGGIGAIQHELMAAGATRGTSVDASSAYLAAARSEAGRRGYASRLSYLFGDFVELAPQLEPVDIVTLDRVVCCYPDMDALVDASASLARRAVGIVIPRDDRRLIRLGLAMVNLLQQLRRHPFRVFVHARADVDRRLEGLGFDRVLRSTSVLWQVLLYARPEGAPTP
jgi:magnesium-protoporphyrin O-methyltransferase